MPMHLYDVILRLRAPESRSKRFEVRAADIPAAIAAARAHAQALGWQVDARQHAQVIRHLGTSRRQQPVRRD